MTIFRLACANLRYRIGQTIGFVALVALLAFIALGGALVSSSLQNGLSSLEARLGADIIIAPDSAKSKADLESILLDGTPGYFYMDKSYLDKIAALEGVEKVSAQYYLATVKAGCCSMPVQVIGFDPETDFTIQPWIARSYASELGREDIVTGSNITGTAGSTVLFYGVECRIVSRLDETGTALDNAVFATNETLRDLIAGSEEQGISVLADNDPEEVISTIQVKVANGYDIGAIADSINLHVRGVTAVQTKAMTSGVADSVAGMANVIGALMGALWLIVLAVLVIAFSALGRHRTREFAALRVSGASRSFLSRLVMGESFVLSLIGALVGIACALVALFAFNGAIEAALGVPFLMPSLFWVLALAAIVFVITLVVGPASSALSARRLSRVDVGQILRED